MTSQSGSYHFGERPESTSAGFGFGQRSEAPANNGTDREESSAGGHGGGGGDPERKPVTYIPAENLSRDEMKRDHNVQGINFEKYSNVPVSVSGDNVMPPIESFARSGLHDLLLEAVRYMGYKTPTPIQKYSIPAILQKRDVMGCAQTGSGKTAGYLLPMISNMLNDGVEPATASVGKAQPQVLIVCPTRELAAQVDKEAHIYVEGSGYRTLAVYGQVDVRYMGNKLRCGVNIVTATTGRLKDCLERGSISLENLQYLVLDEADRMLDMGFSTDIEAIVGNRSMPKDRVTLMFSATFAPEIQNLAKRFLNKYIFVATGIVGGACGDVEQTVVKCESRADKKDMLEELLKSRALENGGEFEKTLIFCETKGETDKIGLELAVNNISSTTIHGDRTQEQREQALADFKRGRKAVLVATNVAARGLDIPDVKHVINWDLPKNADEMSEYVHRIGRTGRVGNKGLATTFYSSRSSVVAPRLIEIMETSGNLVPDWLYQEACMPVPTGDRPRPSNGAGDNRVFGARDTRGPVRVPSPAPVQQSYKFGARADESWGSEPAAAPAKPAFHFGERPDNSTMKGAPEEQTTFGAHGGAENGIQAEATPSKFLGFGRRR